jgi:Trypsin-co-occurring domain 1
MAQLIELQLSSGRSVYVEAEPVRGGGMREMSDPPGERITKKFDEISETLAGVAENLETQLGKLPNGPKKVEVEIHAVVKAGGLLFFAQGSVEGGIKLKLSWER